MSDQHLVDLVCQVGAPLAAEQPWVGWMLVALCRQRAAQTWLLQVDQQHLAHVEEMEGEVPGLPGWTYAYHGTGLCLRSDTGELVDMDFDDEAPAATIDPYFFAGRVHAFRDGHPEARVRAHLPTSDLMAAGLKALRRIGALHHPTSDHVFHLAARLELHHEAIAAIDFGSKRVRRRWAKAFGDHDEAAARARSRAWIVELLQSARPNASMLRQLHDVLSPAQIRAVAEPLLVGRLDAYFAYAVDAMRSLGGPPPGPIVEALDRLDPARHHPFPAHAVTRYLLEHDVQRARCLETIEAFAAVDVVKGYGGNPYRDHLAVLMARHAPDRAWPLLRIAAFEDTPSVYQPIGALLAVHPDPRAGRLLLEAAMSSPPTRKRFLLGCLAHRDDPASQALAREHMPAPPDRSGPFGYSFEEVQYANLRGQVERHLEEARATLASLQVT